MTRIFFAPKVLGALATFVVAAAWAVAAMGQTTSVLETVQTGQALTWAGSAGGALGTASVASPGQYLVAPTSEPLEAPASPSGAPSLPGRKSLEALDNAANYTFFYVPNQTLSDMSSGTTQLIGPNVATAASPLTNIGFDFWFQGVRYTQFSVNANGVLRLGGVAQTAAPYQPLGQAGLPIITAYGAAQRTHAGDGKVHYKVEPSGGLHLVIEWLNMQSDGGGGGTADLTYQMWLFESGTIIFVYGGMTMGATGASLPESKAPAIGFSSDSVANTIGSVTAAQGGAPAPTFNGASATVTTNTYVAGPITVLTSAAQGSRRSLFFIPQPPNAPMNLTFSSVTQVSMTLNWAASANAAFYAIYRSSDGVNYAFETTLLQNFNTYAATSLTPGTTYSWKVLALSAEGGFNTALAGSQATSAFGTISSTVAGGRWSQASTWVGGVVPAAGDHVTIATPATVYVDTEGVAAVAWDLTVQNGGDLRFGNNVVTGLGVTLNVGQSVVIASGGTVDISPTNMVAGPPHQWTIGGDLTNSGSLNCIPNTTGYQIAITFNGATDASLTLGPGSRTTLTVVTVNKGNSSTPVLNFSPAVPFSQLSGVFTVTAGTLKFGGMAVVSFHVDGNIPAAGGVWLNNPNAAIAAAVTGTVSGLLRVTTGALNVNGALNLASGANVLVESGAINVAKSFGVSSPGNAITYNQSGGTVTVSTGTNTSTTIASFDMGTAAGSSVTMSGGTIVIEQPNSAASGPRDYRNQAGGSNPPLPSGGTLQLGDNVTPANPAFNIAGLVPDLTLFGHATATLLPPAVFTNAARNVTIPNGATLNTGDSFLFAYGPSFVNNGTLNATTANAVLFFGSTTTPQGYSGSGIVTAPLTYLAIESDQGLTIAPASPNIVVQNLILYSGNVTNSNKITLGNGGAASSTVQIGDSSPTAAGVFDVPLTFNLGAGGEVVNYLRTTTARTTGNEINPTRVLTSLKYDDNNAAHSLTIAGGSLALTSTGTALTLTNGRIVTGSSYLFLNSTTATVSRTNGRVDGNLRKFIPSVGNKTFEVGTANGYSPVTVNVTAAPGPGFVQVKAVQGPQPNMPVPGAALQRYWTVQTAGPLTGDLTFNYLDADIPAAAAEASYALYRYNGTLALVGGSESAAANSATITGVPFGIASDGDWTLGAPVNMSFTKSHVGTFTQGQNGHYNLGVTNGPTALADGTVITVTDTLPAGLTYVAGMASGWMCGAAGQVVTCTITQMSGAPFSASGGSTIALTVAIAPDAPASIQNTATCTCSTSVPANNAATDITTIVPAFPLTITLAGSGSGQVTGSAGSGITCPGTCSNTYSGGTVITLTATPTNANFIFTGWLGACTGTGTCTVTMNAATNVSATFAPSSIGTHILDIDSNTHYDALTDGLLVIRYMFGLIGAPLTAGAIGAGAGRTDSAAILTYLNDIRPLLDIDGNGVIDALTDGLLVFRYMSGIVGIPLTQGAIGAGATRQQPGDVQTYLTTLEP
jgi:hypothetical protein